MSSYVNPLNSHYSGGFTEIGDAQNSYGGYKGINSSSLAANASKMSGGKRSRKSSRKSSRKYKGGMCSMCSGLFGGKTRKMMSHKKCHCLCHKGKICKKPNCHCSCHKHNKKCHCLCHKGKICKKPNCQCACHQYESQFGGAGYSMPGSALSANHLNQANPTPFAPYN